MTAKEAEVAAEDTLEDAERGGESRPVPRS